MAIIESCCCDCFSVRSGSFCVAFYTSIYFTITLLTAVLTLAIPDTAAEPTRRPSLPPQTPPRDGASQPPTQPPEPSHVPSVLLILLLILSVAGIVSSILLVVGLAKGRRSLLVPLIASLSGTALLDQVVLLTRVVLDLTTYETVTLETILLCIIDTIVLGVNLLSLVCVVSQYQKYSRPSGMLPSTQLSGTQSKLTEPITVPPEPTTAEAARSDRPPPPPDAP